MTQLINENDFEELVLNNKKAVMVDFFAQWCGPCKMIAPYVDGISGELSGEADVFKIDIDKNENLCEKFSVSAVPTLLFFKDGECVDRVVGALSKGAMKEKLRSLM